MYFTSPAHAGEKPKKKGPKTLIGHTKDVQTQSSQPGFEQYVENVLWMEEQIVFSTVHVVGSNNNLAPWSCIDPADSFAAPRHILIKGGRYLEEIGKAEVVCFDKTGTLTTGQARVERIVGVGETSETELLVWAICAEDHSHHPLAVALRTEAGSRGLTATDPARTEAFLGMGVRAVEDGRGILLGNRKLMEQFGVQGSATTIGIDSQHPDRTLVYLAKDGQLVGRFELTQQVRAETPAIIAQLKAAGVSQTVLLTGDEEAVAQPLAEKLGLGRTFASVTPEEKASIVSQLGQDGQTVVMVGDGINDALALAEADVGVAMGAGGSPVAIEAADIALARDDLQGLVYTHTLSRATLDIVHQNFWIATGSNIFGLLLGVTGRLSPMTAGLIHITHTLGVLANSSRLLRDGHGG